MLSEAIILAGGLGTRLRGIMPDLPKSLAPVCGYPFLFYIINHLRLQGITRFVFSLGYKSELIVDYLQRQYRTLDYEYFVEKKPLGTGGGIKAAAAMAVQKNIIVANGDTLFKARLDDALALHERNKSVCTLLLKPMQKFDRYGAVKLHADQTIDLFSEKQYHESGLINAGLYILDKDRFLQEALPDKFSFEKDWLEKYQGKGKISGFGQDEYFIDIGIPEDYQRAQRELKKPALDLEKVNSDWTLFLDRDGVINLEKKDDYVRSWGEFQFCPGAKEAIRVLSEKFGNIIVVSNPRGVGRGLMSEAELLELHEKMKASIEEAGGRITDIFFCPAVADEHPDRKPNPGMAFKAKKKHPSIDLERSFIAGNKPGDMLFGRYCGMYTVFIASTHPDTPFPHPDIDLRYGSLLEFAKAF